MELALYYPQLGYYNNQTLKFGARGDYITAPKISPFFAYSWANQIEQLWLNSPLVREILELGAGEADLAIDLLLHLGSKITKYYILEISPLLKSRQQQNIQTKIPQYFAQVEWLTQLPDTFNGVIVMNEVLDALACNLIHCHQGSITEMGISFSEHEFFYQKMNNSSPTLIKHAQNLICLDYDNYISEINLQQHELITQLAQILNCGAIIICDYGYPAKEYYSLERNHGTLRAFFRHQVSNQVLSHVGLMDITSSIDFSALAHSAISAGLDFIGYTTQADFLINNGILIHLKKNISNPQYLSLTTEVNKLLALNQMGEIFKIIGFSKNINFYNWQSFIQGERSYQL